MKITHKIPWKMAYGQTVVEVESEFPNGGLTGADYASIAVAAADMEDAVTAVGGGPGLEESARAHGAVDIPDMDGTEYNDPAPQRQQPRQPVRQPQRPPQRQQAPQRPPQGETIWCDRCNQPMRAGRVMQGQYGPRRAYDCTSGCFGDKINSKTGQPFPYTTWVDA